MDWVAVGLGQDLRLGMAMPGRINAIDLAIWRSASGQVHAWGDRCPHRGMRLSHGFVRGETLSCIYHGWQYGEDGGCTYIPAHPKLTPPKTICATTYQCQESDGLIWVALEASTSAPLALAGYAPVRSIAVQASLKAIASHFGAPIGSMIEVENTVLVLQPTDSNNCVLHVLSKTEPKEVSRWVETQRKLIERVPA